MSEGDESAKQVLFAVVVVVSDALWVCDHVQSAHWLDGCAGLVQSVQDDYRWTECATDPLIITSRQDLHPIVLPGNGVHGHADTDVQVVRVHHGGELEGVGVELCHGGLGGPVVTCQRDDILGSLSESSQSLRTFTELHGNRLRIAG